MHKFSSKADARFNGVCNFCNLLLTLIIKHIKKEHYLFALLQSDVAKEILLQFLLKNLKRAQ